METKDWITIASVIAFIIGWFVNGKLNRNNEISIKRFEYRMKALNSATALLFFIQKNPSPFANNTFLPLLEEARSNFQLFGKDDEIEVFEKFVSCLENKNLQGANQALNDLGLLIRKKIRAELNIKGDNLKTKWYYKR